MNNLPKFDPNGNLGDELSSRRLNAIVDSHVAGTAQPGRGLRLSKTPGGTTQQVVPFRREFATDPPFHVRLYQYGTEEAPTCKVTVNRGFVIERIPMTGDAISNWLPSNIYDGDELAKFDITPGQAVFVSVATNSDGLIAGSDPVFIVVAAANTESVHSIPDVGDGPATDSAPTRAGQLYYLLATLDAATKKLVPRDNDSHICHWLHRPSFQKIDGDADIFSYYDAENNRYVTKGLSPEDSESKIPVSIRRDGEKLMFGVDPALIPGGGTGKLTVSFYDSTPAVTIAEWANGLVSTNGWKELVFDTLAGGGKLIAINENAMP